MQILTTVAMIWIACAGNVVAQQVSDGMFVTGEGVVSMVPDMATIRLGVNERAASAEAAMDQTAQKVGGILAQLDTLGVAALDRQTSGFYLRPVYDNRPREETTPVQVVGYEAGNTVTVTVRDLMKLGTLLDAVVAEGANDFNGLQFSLQDDSEALALARTKAVADAMARAVQLAQAAGVKLGHLTGMQETSFGLAPVQMRSAEMRSMDMPIETGEVDVRAQVSMQFDIIPGL